MKKQSKYTLILKEIIYFSAEENLFHEQIHLLLVCMCLLFSFPKFMIPLKLGLIIDQEDHCHVRSISKAETQEVPIKNLTD